MSPRSLPLNRPMAAMRQPEKNPETFAWNPGCFRGLWETLSGTRENNPKRAPKSFRVFWDPTTTTSTSTSFSMCTRCACPIAWGCHVNSFCRQNLVAVLTPTNYEIFNKSRPPTTSSLQVQRRVKRLVFKRADTLWNVPCNLSRNVLATLWHLLLFVY